MLRNITLSAEESLIKQARQQAANDQTTLNKLFRKWLARYSGKTTSLSEYNKIMSRLSYAKTGGKFSREEMNER